MPIISKLKIRNQVWTGRPPWTMFLSASLRLCVIMLFASQVQAQTSAPSDSVLDRRVAEIARVLRCPVCQGLSINDSPSQLSLEMKQVVREQLQAGKSPDEIKAYFVSKYGEWILLEPKPRGMNLFVYLAPFILLVGGGALIVVMVRKWTRGSTGSIPEPEPDTDL